MKKYSILASLALAALFTLTACSLGGVAPLGQSAGEQTQIARAVEQTLAAEGAGPVPPASTAEAAPGAPTVSVSVSTNCRTGPGEPYEILGILAVGQEAEVVGRNEYGDTWIIRLPSDPSITCWLWGYHATVVGDTSGLTVLTPPPTPALEVDFTLSYQHMYHCGGLHGFVFRLTNTGNVTIKSYLAGIFDTTQGVTTKDFTDDYFIEITNACETVAVLEELSPGETGSLSNLTSASFHYDPGGHTIDVTVRLCTEDGQAGVCAQQSITFTP